MSFPDIRSGFLLRRIEFQSAALHPAVDAVIVCACMETFMDDMKSTVRKGLHPKGGYDKMNVE